MPQIENINWFPGHMAKTRRQIEKVLPLIDGIIEILDARIPYSSQNPDIEELTGHLPRVILLNKADVADDAKTAQWVDWFARASHPALKVDCRSGKGLQALFPAVRQQLQGVLQRNRERGMEGKPLRLLIVGIPNVGKSSFINRMAGKSRAKVADRPGVTRGNQWFTIEKGIEMMDTPGVLWAKFEEPRVGENLALTGAIKDEIMDGETLAVRLIERISPIYPNVLEGRYGVSDAGSREPFEVLEDIGRKRGMLIRGGQIDTERASRILLDEFRGGKLGRMTLELAPL